MKPANAREDAQAIFRAGLSSVDPEAMMRGRLSLDGSVLRVGAGGGSELSYDLDRYGRVVALGMGKAGARMALGLEAALGDRLEGGLVAVKAGYVEATRRVKLLEASHPVPDESSAEAARSVAALARGLGEEDLAIVLVSGGGSALLCAPYESEDGRYRLTLEDKAEATRALLACGATIQEVNCVRKHLSLVKGGRLAEAMAPATGLVLVLSDVIGDELDAIASGPAVPDMTTYAQALAAISRHGAAVPEPALRLLRAGAEGRLPETPKPGDPVFAKSRNVLLGSNRQALEAAEREARARGYSTLVLGSRLVGEAREAALFLLGVGAEIASGRGPIRPPACLLAGGETTVTLRGAGKGGRNQEMALAFLAGLGRGAAGSAGLAGRMTFLSAGTDGSDGPTDAAGAFASLDLLEAARAAGLDPEAYLANNDSYRFFDALGGLLRTGPTNTNVCDLQILVVE